MARIECRFQGGLVRGLKAAVIALALLVATIPAARAQTYTVMFDGVTYEIVGLGIGESFDANEAAIRAAPWWGDLFLSQVLAPLVRLQTGPVPWHAFFAVATEDRDFGFGTIVTGTTWTSATTATSNVDRRQNFQIDSDATTWVQGEDFQFFTVTSALNAVPVPELDAPALLHALIILLAFGLWLRARPPRVPERRAASRPTSPRRHG